MGASADPHKIGGRPLLYLSRFNYRGRVYPINPTRHSVQGVAALPDVASLPEAPDLAIVAVPRDQAAEQVAACARRGAKAAIVMTSGFAEVSEAGRAAQNGLVECARRSGMRLIGPNSQGLANFGTGAIASFSTIFLECEPADGPVAIVSQSGALGSAIYGELRRRGIGVRHLHTTGNDADVTVAEVAGWVVADPAVRLVLLYAETLADMDVLAGVAAAARARGVAIVALKSGRTPRGRAAAAAHTGALPHDDAALSTFFHEHGIWRASDMHDLVNAAELYVHDRAAAGRSLVVVSNSGACGVMAADDAERFGLVLADLDESTRAAVARELPSFASSVNPVDLTAALLTNSRLLGAVLPILAAAPGADLFLIGLIVAGLGYDIEAMVADTAAFAARVQRPVAVVAPQPAIAARFRSAGLAAFENETDALRALGQLAAHHALMHRLPKSEVGRRTSEVGSPKPEARSLKPEV